MRNRLIVPIVLGFLALTGMVAMAEDQDAYLWLEDVHGAKPLAWVAEQNTRTKGVVEADPRYQTDHDAVLKVLDATDRIPMGSIVRQYVFNFWQDAENPKGVWRRTTVADYANPSPHWEILIDVDKLATDEHENWIWKGATCTDDLKRCLVLLSRDGGDAHVIREFDLTTKTFVKDGFTLAHAKSDASYIDDDTIIFDTDFGADTMTKSGYPRIVKIWHRGEAIDKAKTLLEGKPEDIAVQTSVMSGPAGTYAMVVRGVSFFENEYSHVLPDGSLAKLSLPLSADIKGMIGDQLILTLRKDWSVGGRTYAKGALLSVSRDTATGAPDKLDIATLYVPGPRSSVAT
jgi:prolyl oligopeptidase